MKGGIIPNVVPYECRFVMESGEVEAIERSADASMLELGINAISKSYR